MKSTLFFENHGLRCFLLVMDKGDEAYEHMELASCIGDIADNNGTTALHAHIVRGRRDSTAIAGHLQKLHVFPTMEVVLTETPAHLHKRIDPHTGLTLLDLRNSKGG